MADFVAANYPEEFVYAKAGVVYAANQCVWRMGASHCYDKRFVKMLQLKYRSLEIFFLRYGKNGLFSKFFSVCAFVSVDSVVKAVSIIYKIKKKYAECNKRVFSK